MDAGTKEKCIAIIVIGALAALATIITKNTDLVTYAILAIGSLTGNPGLSLSSDKLAKQPKKEEAL